MIRFFDAVEWLCFSSGFAMLIIGVILVPNSLALGQGTQPQGGPPPCPQAYPSATCNLDCQPYIVTGPTYYCSDSSGQQGTAGTCTTTGQNCNAQCTCRGHFVRDQNGIIIGYACTCTWN